MKKILIMCNVDPNTSPRPNRMSEWLKDQYQVTILGRQIARISGIENSFLLSSSGLFGTLDRNQSLTHKIRAFLYRLLLFFKKDYEGLIWASLNRPAKLLNLLADMNFDLIITHDCTLLPMAFSVKGETAAKIMLDAREYYPKNFDDRWLWRIFVKPLNEYLCAKYIPLCDKIITVSQGIAREYEHAYGVHAEVVMSLPRSSMLSPAAARSDRFRLIHHGSASQSRRIEDMVELMDYTDKRFSLDLMLVGDGPYMSRLRRMVERRRNVRILPPVAMQEIVPFIHQYDIGVFLCPPSNFNLKYALPNKLFEFIQARLAVAVSPSVEMRTIVEDYNCGIVSNDFSPQSMAHALNSLTSEKIAFFKNQSHKAAAKLNAEANQTRVLEIVDDLIGKG